MGAISHEKEAVVRARSTVGGMYDTSVNGETAYEILSKRAGGEPARRANAGTPASAPADTKPQAAPTSGGGLGELIWGSKRRQGLAETLAKQAARTVGSEVGRQIIRGVLGGILGGA